MLWVRTDRPRERRLILVPHVVSSESHATRSLTFPLSRCLCVLTCNIALSTRMFCLANGRGSYSNNVTLMASVLVRAYYSTALTRKKKRLLFCDKRVMAPKRCSSTVVKSDFFSLVWYAWSMIPWQPEKRHFVARDSSFVSSVTEKSVTWMKQWNAINKLEIKIILQTIKQAILKVHLLPRKQKV